MEHGKGVTYLLQQVQQPINPLLLHFQGVSLTGFEKCADKSLSYPPILSLLQI